MNRRSALTSLAAAALLAHLAGPRRAAAAASGEAWDFSFTDIDGKPLDMAQFRGKAVLVVNTASRCGFTGQYDGLQKLWTEYRDKGLVVLGVPSDDFNQELASEAAVKDFCEMNYGIDFPMTAITHVRGSLRHPFYAWAERSLGPDAAPRWNFHKVLVGPDGKAVAAFGTGVEPMSAKVVSAIEKTLGAG